MLTKKNINEVIKNSGIKKGDNIFCHSDLSKLKKLDFEYALLLESIYNSLMKVIGKNGTLVVPTFTYSFCNKEIFDVKNFITPCGSFSNYVKNIKNSKIYADPNVSVAIVGKNKRYFSKNPTINSYDLNSFFDRFFKKGGKICNINLDITSTFIHYFERKLGVKYRFDKVFNGKIKFKNKLIKKKSIIFVRYLKKENKQNLRKFISKSKKYTNSSKKEKLVINTIDIKDYYKIIKTNLSKDENFLINKN
tara:strand:- start:5 stop:751 length:747 start_codon:yes stop_codon:yes gene_type:complete